MAKALLVKLKESLISVLPIAIIVLIISFTPLAPLTATEQITFAVCAVMLILGIGLFNLGADLAMTPMGGHVGTGLTKSKKVLVLVSVCFIMGVLITVAEPDLSVLASQVSDVMNNTVLIVTVGVGVGIFLIIAVLKIVFHKSLSMLLMFFYMMIFAICAMLIECGKNDFLALSFDSGGVTTGPITVPFIMALGFGIATTIGGRDANENSFGLIALCSIGPIIAVMILSLCSKGEISQDTLNALASYETVEGSLALIGHSILNTAKDVLLALALIVVFFLILQFTVLKLPRQKLAQIGIGIAYTFFGLVIFLVAVEVGFMPIGFKLGTEIARFSQPVLAVFGLVIGFVVVLAEPAVHVLNKQVEQVTGGGGFADLRPLAPGIDHPPVGFCNDHVKFGKGVKIHLVPNGRPGDADPGQLQKVLHPAVHRTHRLLAAKGLHEPALLGGPGLVALCHRQPLAVHLDGNVASCGKGNRCHAASSFLTTGSGPESGSD